MPVDDAWDWPLLYYTATVLLNKTEGEFWRMTPRKLNAVTKTHIELNKSQNSSGPKKGFIDQIM